MGRTIALKKRFRLTLYRSGKRFHFIIVCGLLGVAVARDWDRPDDFTRRSEIRFFWIPPKHPHGYPVPCWTPYMKITRTEQEYFDGKVSG